MEPILEREHAGKKYQLFPDPDTQRGCEGCALNPTPKNVHCECMFYFEYDCIDNNGIWKLKTDDDE